MEVSGQSRIELEEKNNFGRWYKIDYLSLTFFASLIFIVASTYFVHTFALKGGLYDGSGISGLFVYYRIDPILNLILVTLYGLFLLVLLQLKINKRILIILVVSLILLSYAWFLVPPALRFNLPNPLRLLYFLFEFPTSQLFQVFHQNISLPVFIVLAARRISEESRVIKVLVSISLILYIIFNFQVISTTAWVSNQYDELTNTSTAILVSNNCNPLNESTDQFFDRVFNASDNKIINITSGYITLRFERPFTTIFDHCNSQKTKDEEVRTRSDLKNIILEAAENSDLLYLYPHCSDLIAQPNNDFYTYGDGSTNMEIICKFLEEKRSLVDGQTTVGDFCSDYTGFGGQEFCWETISLGTSYENRPEETLDEEVLEAVLLGYIQAPDFLKQPKTGAESLSFETPVDNGISEVKVMADLVDVDAVVETNSDVVYDDEGVYTFILNLTSVNGTTRLYGGEIYRFEAEHDFWSSAGIYFQVLDEDNNLVTHGETEGFIEPRNHEMEENKIVRFKVEIKFDPEKSGDYKIQIFRLALEGEGYIKRQSVPNLVSESITIAD